MVEAVRLWFEMARQCAQEPKFWSDLSTKDLTRSMRFVVKHGFDIIIRAKMPGVLEILRTATTERVRQPHQVQLHC